ncbi:hypothetical protein M0812_25172 [Anaeramoeba flamelloides]|uniref:Uncharacterized protein n=1 Tax=Anaeramoeba flamelloides TaxID=1746091 RepID=A0AAV7YIX6_9EUKA|nr:hypothetical protein M0812_25172 [Anaeramoeba flamelloides]
MNNSISLNYNHSNSSSVKNSKSILNALNFETNDFKGGIVKKVKNTTNKKKPKTKTKTISKKTKLTTNTIKEKIEIMTKITTIEKLITTMKKRAKIKNPRIVLPITPSTALKTKTTPT